MLKTLRIAVTALSLTVCVLLIALWERSYSRLDVVTYGVLDGPGYKFMSLKGEILAIRYSSREGAVSLGWHIANVPVNGVIDLSSRGPWELLGFSFGFTSKGRPYLAVLPLWFVLTLAATVAAAPWMQLLNCRFSLRTLLIATTLVAVGLGAIVLLS